MSEEPATKKKVCLLGAFAVGKTSLVRRFVSGVFAERYLSTIGVKIDRKAVRVGGRAVDLIIWDIAGGTDAGFGHPAYLRGLSGFIVVGDGTRPETCRVTRDLARFVHDNIGPCPSVLLLNKSDLAEQWGLDGETERSLAASVGACLRTSAKNGVAVDQAFQRLATAMLAEEHHVHGP